jgi:glycosyltransferase involved in cell wall biosynthesis
MKILHINNYLEKGGAEVVFKITFTGLNEQYPDIANYVAYTTDSREDSYNINKDNIFIFDNWQWYGKIRGVINYIFSYKNYKLMNKILLSVRPDIVHLHGFYASLSPSILLSLCKYKDDIHFKVVQTLHDYHIFCPNSSFYSYSHNRICTDCLNNKIKLKIFWYNCDRRGIISSIVKGIRSILSLNIIKHFSVIDFFIVSSLFMKDMFLKEKKSISNVAFIKNPILNSNLIKNYDFKRNEIVYFGRFSREKKISFLVNTFMDMHNENLLPKDITLTLIGGGEELSILKDIKKESNSSSIIIKPFMEHGDLLEYIKKSKYFVLPSICFENSPLSILEAYQAGLIPIVSDIGGMKEIVEYFGIGYTFLPNDKNSLKSALLSAIKNYKLDINKFSLIEKKLDEFSLKNYLRNLVELYNICLAKDG